MEHRFDIIVVGAGHSGCEAALAAARMGHRTLLLTLNSDRVGYLSCNPAMGGLAKGQLVKEIDALGGEMGLNTDRSGIQFKRLNASKGPAVRSSRAQCDKYLYASGMKEVIENTPNLFLQQREIVSLKVEQGRVVGAITNYGETIFGRAIILTTGTFLGGLMHTGATKEDGGRAGDSASFGLTAWLVSQGFRMMRLKTGTPPRLERKSIDWTRFETQWGDATPRPFSVFTDRRSFPIREQVCCWIAYTNDRTHEIIANNFGLSPMFTGVIKGLGPRYCPSIEDKVKRFSDRDRHQVFLEPEGLQTKEIYANGLSTSLPLEVQQAFLRSMEGLEQVVISRPGYAVEYDCIDPSQLFRTMESKQIEGLFFAGQINGTSGYEEAGAQGLVAGINAALKIQRKDPFVMKRSESYIGVLIDDLITKGADEPYRMFTSRAEYRLLLREDNADIRLSGYGHRLGLLSTEKFRIVESKILNYQQEREKLNAAYFKPTVEFNESLVACGTTEIKDRINAATLLKRPEVAFNELKRLGYEPGTTDNEVLEQVEISVKYEGYIRKDLELIELTKKNDELPIPLSLNYEEMGGLSSEVKEKLARIRPETLGQALRIPGVTPAAVACLLLEIRHKGAFNKPPFSSSPMR